jgi:hypothetical protein
MNELCIHINIIVNYFKTGRSLSQKELSKFPISWNQIGNMP